MKANDLKVTFMGKGITATLVMATDSRRPKEMVDQIQRILNSNGFEFVHWISISFLEDSLEVDSIVREASIIGAYRT